MTMVLHGLRYAWEASMPLNGSLGTPQRETTARLWKSLRLTFERTLLKLLGPPTGPMTRLRRRTKPPLKRMKGQSSLLPRTPAVLLLTSRRSWMSAAACRIAYPMHTALVSIFVKPTSEEPSSTKPTSKKPASKEPSSTELASKEPASKEPTSKKPTSKEPASEKPTSKKPTSKKPTSKEPVSKEPASKEPESPTSS